MLEFDSTTLKPWLHSQLEPISDADPAVLSEYILALLKHDAPFSQLKQHCADQLREFLGQQTNAFISKLFFHLTSSSATINDEMKESYFRLKRKQPDDSVDKPAVTTGHSALSPSALQSVASPPSTLKGSRSSQARNTSRSSPSTHPRVYTPPQRAIVARQPDIHGHLMFDQAHFDWQYPPASTMHPPSFGPSSHPSKALCEAYHRYGFCPQGNSCPFVHDVHNDPRIASASLIMAGPSGPAPNLGIPTDPATARLPRAMNPRRHSRTHGSAAQVQRPKPHVSAFATPTLRLENVPRESLDENHIRLYFQRFGDVDFIRVDHSGRGATVTFSTPAQAEQAISSPEAILGNRFIRLHRFVKDSRSLKESEQNVSSVPSSASASHSTQGIRSPLPRTPRVLESSTGSEIAESAELHRHHASLLEANASAQSSLIEQLEHCAEPRRKAALLKEVRTLTTEAIALRASAEKAKDDHAALMTLEKLRQEASSLGITIDAQADSSKRKRGLKSTQSTTQGFTRSMPPRTWAKLDSRAFRLDNRKKTISITCPSGDVSVSHVESALSGAGAVVQVRRSSDQEHYIAEFSSAFSAEKVMNRKAEIQDSLHGAELSWMLSTSIPHSSASVS